MCDTELLVSALTYTVDLSTERKLEEEKERERERERKEQEEKGTVFYPQISCQV